MLSLGAEYHRALALAPVFRDALSRAVTTNHPILASLVVELTLAVGSGRGPSLIAAWSLHDAEEEEERTTLAGTLLYNVSPDKLLEQFPRATWHKVFRSRGLMEPAGAA